MLRSCTFCYCETSPIQLLDITILGSHSTGGSHGLPTYFMLIGSISAENKLLKHGEKRMLAFYKNGFFDS